MEKNIERSISQWLKNTGKDANLWLKLSILAGLANGLFIIIQAGLLAHLLHRLIIEQEHLLQHVLSLTLLFLIFPLRSVAIWAKERTGFNAGAQIRVQLRSEILNKLDRLGSAHVQQNSTGAWSNILLEQVEKLQDFYAKYLPQMMLVGLIPFAILVVVFPINWVAGLVFIVTAPLTVLFMALVGMGAADANKRNFLALARLSGHFLDRLKGLGTIRQFDRIEAEVNKMEQASEQFRQRTMEVLKMAFLSSAVLEFFASISIALIAVYFGFSYLGELNFGHYGAGVTLFTGFLILMLAPEFFQPFRDLGTYYHARAEAVGAASEIIRFLDTAEPETGSVTLKNEPSIAIAADQFQALSIAGVPLSPSISFDLKAGQCLTIGGESGCGKSSLLNAIMGLLPYSGSLKINGQELATIQRSSWHQQLTWLGQNPNLIHGTIAENLQLAAPEATNEQLFQALSLAHAKQFVMQLPNQLLYPITDHNGGLSVGQAQRIALARALLKPSAVFLLDEPSASLDQQSEKLVQQSLQLATQGKTQILISHRAEQLAQGDIQIVLNHSVEEHINA